MVGLIEDVRERQGWESQLRHVKEGRKPVHPLDDPAETLNQAFAQTVAQCEEIAANMRIGLEIVQEVMFGGGAETFVQATLELSQQILTAAQQFIELQVNWSAQGF